MANRNSLVANRPQMSGSQPAWLTTLRSAIEKTITPEVIEEMILAQVEKAKSGNAHALKLVMDLISQPHHQEVHATQNVFHVHLPDDAHKEDTTRIRIFAFLEAMGPHTAGEIGANLGIDPVIVDEKLDHPWFRPTLRSHQRAWAIHAERN